MPKTTVSSSSAVEEKVDVTRIESEPMIRTKGDRGQKDSKLSKSEPIEEQRAYGSAVNEDPALAPDIDAKIRQILRDTRVDEGIAPAALQTDASHTSTSQHHMPTHAQPESYTDIAGTAVSDSTQKARARALFKKYGLDVELGSINESKEDNDSNNNDQAREEGRERSFNSNNNNDIRVAPAEISLDIEYNTNTKNTNDANKMRVERIKKPILIRIKRRCHHCQTVFGAGDYCEECDHEKCDECPRSPLPGSITQKASVAGTHSIGAGISQEKRRTSSAGKHVNKGVARVVTKWLDDMEPCVEGTSRLLKENRQSLKHSDFMPYTPFSPSPSLSASEKKKKKMRKRKKRDRHSDNGRGDSQRPNETHLDIKSRSTSRTHGPTAVVALPTESYFVPFASSKACSRSKYDPRVKQSHDGRGTQNKGRLNPIFQSEVCHACRKSVIPTLTSMCPECQHIRCENCPRFSSFDITEVPENTDMSAAAAETIATNAKLASHHRQAQQWYQRQYQSLGHDAREEYAQYLQNLVIAKSQRQRVYKKPRIRVRWACDLCFSALDTKSRMCVGCGHQRCKNCIRDPEKRKPSPPDPDVVQALEARLSSILLHDPHAPQAQVQ